MKKERTRIPLDSSAIIHLAVRRKNYTNSFRISATLTDTVCPHTLQSAVNRLVPQFPTIVAGIKAGVFQYFAVPAKTPPCVCLDHVYLAEMSEDMIKNCAVRILYCDKRISVEIFHSLTDGFGGLVFLNALIAEYLCQKENISATTANVLQYSDACQSERETDAYLTYVGAQTAPLNSRKVYRLHSKDNQEQTTQIVTGIYNTQELIGAAHYFGVSLTAFLTAVMADAIFEMRKLDTDKRNVCKPLQIMIPINLRKRFPSKTLRNFSLYALPHIMPEESELPFEKLVQIISNRLGAQLSEEYLTAMITTSVKLQKLPFLCIIPLFIKNFFLRIGFRFCGERNSCLSISNLGEIAHPAEVRQYVHHIDFSLTPRRNAPYNCGVASYNDKLAITFTKQTAGSGLEWYFFKCLADMGYCANIKLENYSESQS